MHQNWEESEQLDAYQYIPEHQYNEIIFVELNADEIHPQGAKYGRFVASYEEILHLITQAGYAHAHPNIFGEKPNTAIANAMDKARGGHFKTTPNQYPAGAWYTYDDPSCDYSCQITEYIYWGLSSTLGAQNLFSRYQQINHEWQLNTPSKVKNTDPTLYKLLTHPIYNFPTRLPNGHYNLINN